MSQMQIPSAVIIRSVLISGMILIDSEVTSFRAWSHYLHGVFSSVESMWTFESPFLLSVDSSGRWVSGENAVAPVMWVESLHKRIWVLLEPPGDLPARGYLYGLHSDQSVLTMT